MKNKIGAKTGARVRAPGAHRHIHWLAALATLAVCVALWGTTGIVFAGVRDYGLTVSPGKGPAGTTVTVSGGKFGPGDHITIGIAQGNCSSGSTTISGASGTAGSDGSVSITVTVPNLAPGSYVICATDQETPGHDTNPPPFTVLAVPTITVSSPINSGQPVTVKGSGFQKTGDGGSVDVSYSIGTDVTGCTTAIQTVNPDDGTFSITFNAPAVTSDTTITIVAVQPQGTCGKTPGPTVQAKATGTVVAPVVPATINVDGPVNSGAATTVTGKHFQPGSQVQVLYGAQGSNGCANNIGTANVGSDGNFTLQFAAPNETKDTHLTVAAVQPSGRCEQATKKATADLLVHGQSSPFPFPPQYCLIGLLLLLLLLLLLFLLFRGRRKDEPVTIEERDRVVPNPNAPPGTPGSALVDRQIIARDAHGKEVVIAEEVTTVSEDEELS